jgi:23S rRNA pseudouridine1911/1915/1917 synthase
MDQELHTHHLPLHVSITVGEDAVGMRLDKFLECYFQEQMIPFSRSFLHKMIEQAHVLIDGQAAKKSQRLSVNNLLQLNFPAPKPIDLQPEEVPFDILYEDTHLAVVYKPPGIVVHPSKGHSQGTLVHGLLQRIQFSIPIGDSLRPGIVHRLDKDTAGVMLIAKTGEAHRLLIEAFKEKTIQKTYHALVRGSLRLTQKGKAGWLIDKPIIRHPTYRKKFTVLNEDGSESMMDQLKGKAAQTHCHLLQQAGIHAWLKVQPLTGRTHQIRVHLSSEGLPIVGDLLYSKHHHYNTPYMALVAKHIRFQHPIAQEWLQFSCDDPPHFIQLKSTFGFCDDAD